MINERNTPEVRFDGFSDEWIQKTINGYGYFYYGKSAPKWSVQPDASTPCIRYGELYTKFDGLVDRVYSYTTIPPSSLKFSTGREVLVPRVGEEPLDFARCSWLSLPNIAIGEMISVYNTEQNPLFVALYFSAMMRQAFADKVEGGNVSNLYFNRLLDLEVSFPSVQEQEHVAEFFRFLNDTITLIKQQHEQIVNIKKAMLDKMFPKKGADVPEIRFDGFTGAWVQAGLIEALSPSVGNNTLSRADLNYENGEVLNIHYGDILVKFGSFVDVSSDDIPFITDGLLTDYKNNLLQDGDVIFADTAEDETAGKVIEITSSIGTNIVSGLHTMVYRPKTKFAPYFLGYYLNSNSYRHQMIPLLQGAKVLSISRSNLAKTKLSYPVSLDEQTAIGNFFRNFDALINAQQEELVKLQNIKKACLSKMFV